jgi:hypothetical protein
MGAKFVVDRACVVKRDLSVVGLVESLRYQTLLKRVHQLAEVGAARERREQPLALLLNPGEGEAPPLTVGELEEQVGQLQQYRLACRNCPAALRGHLGGCLGYIPYPISAGMEYLFWLTGVQALSGGLPAAFSPTALAFVTIARGLTVTPFADEMRARGQILASAPRLYQSGPLWRRTRFSTSQLLDAFFATGTIQGEGLRIHAGFLGGLLALGRGLEGVIEDQAQVEALKEELEPYEVLYQLTHIALDQGVELLVWP